MTRFNLDRLSKILDGVFCRCRLKVTLAFLLAFGPLVMPSQAVPVSQEHPYTLIFEQAAKEFNVPSSLLRALGWAESHWSMRDGQPSIDQAYGIMGLRSREDFDALGQAAQLIGLSPEHLKSDPVANIRGAAALLRHLADELLSTGLLPPNDRPETWEEVLIQYSGIPNPYVGLDC